MKGKTNTKSKVNEYNAVGSPEEKEADDTMPEFNAGGKVKKAKKHAHGGHADGKAPKHRLDRKPRASGGRSPYSTGEKVSGGAAEDDEGKREETGPGAETELEIYNRGGHAKAKHGSMHHHEAGSHHISHHYKRGGKSKE